MYKESVRPEQSIGVYKGSVGVHRAGKCTNGLHKAHYSEQCNTKPGEKITRKMQLLESKPNNIHTIHSLQTDKQVLITLYNSTSNIRHEQTHKHIKSRLRGKTKTHTKQRRFVVTVESKQINDIT